MRIGMLTTHNQACGIGEHAHHLMAALYRNGVGVKILKNIPYEPLVVEGLGEDFAEEIVEVWKVGIRTNEKFFDYDKAINTLKDCDLLHIQFESALYYKEQFETLVQRVKTELDIPVIVTYHSSCIWPSGCWNLVDGTTTASKALAEAVRCIHIPHGMRNEPDIDPRSSPPYMIRAFGLARNRDDVVIPAIKKLQEEGIEVAYETSYGNHKWKPIEELFAWLQDSHCIVIFYPPTDALVCSSAFPLAYSARRPVVISDTKWFDGYKHLGFVAEEDNLSEVFKEALQVGLSSYRVNAQEVIDENSWDAKARTFISYYGSFLR